MPRDTLTAPLILPLACTSAGPRTSTISTLPRPIRARASVGGTRGTAALASASNSLTLDGIGSSSGVAAGHRVIPAGLPGQREAGGCRRLLPRVKRRGDRVGPGL